MAAVTLQRSEWHFSFTISTCARGRRAAVWDNVSHLHARVGSRVEVGWSGERGGINDLLTQLVEAIGKHGGKTYVDSPLNKGSSLCNTPSKCC